PADEGRVLTSPERTADPGHRLRRRRSASDPVADQFEKVSVGVEEVQTLVVAPVDRGVVRDPALGEDAPGRRVVVPRDLEGVVALAQRVLDLLEAAGRSVGFEEQRTAALA